MVASCCAVQIEHCIRPLPWNFNIDASTLPLIYVWNCSLDSIWRVSCLNFVQSFDDTKQSLGDPGLIFASTTPPIGLAPIPNMLGSMIPIVAIFAQLRKYFQQNML